MFDLFVQGERGLDRSEGGLGLGLTLVRRLVDLHGGTVTASSQGPGRGSEFEVRLPLDRAGAARRRAPSGGRGAVQAVRAYRVLVVDDNEDSAETMAALVGMWGHDVRTAARRRGALQAAAEHRPEVVLLDIGLPHISGYEVAAADAGPARPRRHGPDRDDGLRPGGRSAPHARGRLHSSPHEAGAAGDAEGDPVVADGDGRGLPTSAVQACDAPGAAALAPGWRPRPGRTSASNPGAPPRARKRRPSTSKARPAR